MQELAEALILRFTKLASDKTYYGLHDRMLFHKKGIGHNKRETVKIDSIDKCLTVLAAYLRSIEKGQPLDRQQLIDQQLGHFADGPAVKMVQYGASLQYLGSP